MKKIFGTGSFNGGDKYRISSNTIGGSNQMTLQKGGSSSYGGDKV